MNWIQVVYFKLKEIWPLFSPAEATKTGSFFTSLPPKQMKIWKYETKSQSKGHEVSIIYYIYIHIHTYIYIYIYIYIYTISTVINKFENFFFVINVPVLYPYVPAFELLQHPYLRNYTRYKKMYVLPPSLKQCMWSFMKIGPLFEFPA